MMNSDTKTTTNLDSAASVQSAPDTTKPSQVLLSARLEASRCVIRVMVNYAKYIAAASTPTSALIDVEQ